MSEKNNNNTKLPTLRQKIDEIDNQIIELLAKRMDIVDEVAILKRENGENIFIKSNREADMIKDITKKLDNRYPKSHIVAIWRKIISAANLHEQDVNIGLYNPNNIADYKYLIAEYYSRDFAIQKFDNARKLIADIESKKIRIGILPVPKNDDEFWWQLMVDSKIKIFAKIPFIKIEDNDFELFCIAIKDVEPSYEDIALLYLETKEEFLSNQLEEILQDCNFELRCILSQNFVQDRQIFLCELNGFVSNDDLRLNELAKKNLVTNILGYYATQI